MSSYDGVNYTLRPSKQLERKLIIDLLSMQKELQIQDYRYVGFGSVFFYDFLLFHKYLGIQDMISLEIDDIEDRLFLNQPYDFIKIYMDQAKNTMGEIAKGGKKVFVWLDYDGILEKNHLEDIEALCTGISDNSIILITINAQRDYYLKDKNLTDEAGKNRDLLQSFQQAFPELTSHYSMADFSSTSFCTTLTDIFHLKINNSLNKQKFQQLFNYTYHDGVQMVTYGGILLNEEANELQSKRIISTKDPKKIRSANLTQCEKRAIDKNIVKITKLLEKDMYEEIYEIVGCKLKKTLIKQYVEFYRFHPNYLEAII